ncbi:MAG TPA: EAL domain-containing protein [Edaphobacter sp.]|nr:EAL domain-containing protein [Edaphobacter sp.]
MSTWKLGVLQPRSWKIGLAVVSVFLVLGEFWRLNPHLRFTSIVVIALILVGAILALWALWLEYDRAIRRRAAVEAQSKFLAATETSLDAFVIFEAVRNNTGEIVDFRFQYVNANFERMMGKTREQLLGRLRSQVTTVPIKSELFERLCEIVATGKPMKEEFLITDPAINATWLRLQVTKLDDGVAMTCCDISGIKSAQEQYKNLLDFTDSVFQNAPFSIIATDPAGMITAMNVAAEKLTGYNREELVGKAPLTVLHDEAELLAKIGCDDPATVSEEDAFKALTLTAVSGETEEQEWTLIRRDGGRTSITLAMRAVHSNHEEITGYVGIAVDITERRQMLDYVTHLATHDQLTGLMGRALLRDKTVEAMERGRRYGTKVAVFMIDLDHFKRINDSLGHTSGDQILVEAANRLRRSVRSTDIVARAGGDEFVVVMPDITSIADVDQCAANLVSRLAPEISVDEHMVKVTASVGACVYPDFASDVKHLFKRADAAMYAAKESGRNQHQIFSEDMLKETADRLMLEHALRHAIPNGELELHYQPQVSLTTGAVTGMEALMRWNHPRLGKISPAQFIPLAEETGLIVPIGEWAFMTACREGKALQEELGADLTISVNLSPRQFQQKNLVQIIEHSLAKSGLVAEHLEIEITEGILMVNSHDNLDKLQKIRELGVRISIDDFGTGFCNFSYLLQYPVDRLKIDQSFVRQAETDMNAAAVVRTIIAMSHGLNIKVVAEGVETDEQLRFLLRKKCDEAQGNFLGYPVPAREFAPAVRLYSENLNSNIALLQST